MPRLEPIWQKYRGKGLTVVAIERTRRTDMAKKFIADNHLTYRFLEDGDGAREVVRKVFGVRGFPTSYLIDRRGRVVFVHRGFEPGDEATIDTEVARLLAE